MLGKQLLNKQKGSEVINNVISFILLENKKHLFI